ncbi:hypothetical protein [Ruminiclostridium cellulolyticum]|uniref:Uncharacterized protein n=1 Tax=Ruminiclostridium cellulolyticum (strain ATCC 35319 / DSM 5812 / JCM 6584 / H10) TaxID=394503 RepID=B8I914_RUMCH|nr:hypothetical protein [Ruminiclostridium cellulolyticum]ACL77346.1 hypothetical protein Ccel_3054 [Ruminiclostridium cellulolyticum H10]
MPDEEQIQKWKDKIEWYKGAYFGMYGKQPSEKLIESYCSIYHIPWPLPKANVIVDEWDFLD